jgi:hypothetical protein
MRHSLGVEVTNVLLGIGSSTHRQNFRIPYILLTGPHYYYYPLDELGILGFNGCRELCWRQVI